MSRSIVEARTWLEDRYRSQDLRPPAFRWAERDSVRRAGAEPGSALLVSDPGLRLHLLFLELDGIEADADLAARMRADLEQAAALGAACRPAAGPGRPGGGAAWRVAVHWLGAWDQAGAWRAVLIALRQAGLLPEAVGLHGSFPEAGETLPQALDRSGCPALLLAVRAALRRTAQEAEGWASADDRVRAALAGVDLRPLAPRARAILAGLRAAAAEAGPAAAAPGPGPALRLGPVTVSDVRGIRRVELASAPEAAPVQAWIVAGPNGSGKSSLAEAMALRAFGASAGLCSYLQDGDVSRGRTAQGYLEQCLAPLDGGVPACSLDGGSARIVPAPDLESALAGLAEAEGTVVEQGGPGAFVRTGGEALGARMARSFSALATRLAAQVAAGRGEAGEARTALARRYGISAATRLAASFRAKITRQLVRDHRPTAAPAALALLATRAALPGPDGARAAALDRAWRAAREEDLAVPDDAGPEALEEALRAGFAADAARLDQTGALLADLRSACAALPFPTAGLGAHLGPWAAWLGQPREPAPPAPPSGPAGPELEALLAERAALAAEGSRARPRRDHLAQVLGLLRAHADLGQAHACPTCGGRLEGPALATLEALLGEADARLAQQREAYAALSRRIKDLEGLPSTAAAGACPVPAEARRQIRAFVQAVLDPAADPEALVQDPAARAALEKLLAGPDAWPAAAPAGAGPGAAAVACAGALRAAWQEAERVLAEPEAWDQVSAALTACLSRVVAEHLPATLEGLWRELAAALSPAPWLIPAPPRFQARTLRGSNRVEVVLDGPDGQPRLARHLLNAAQADTLGLAWTFCQYLVRARFRHAWLLLDDPARDLDQVAHRAFCRFLASFLALHEEAGLPLGLVLLAGQEDRALAAARETGRDLLVLGWTGRQEEATVQRVPVFPAEARSPQPGDLWP